jgi:hypothetical protein
MGAKVIIHRTSLTPEEKDYRMEQLKQSVIEFHREVEHEKTKLQKKTKEIINNN